MKTMKELEAYGKEVIKNLNLSHWNIKFKVLKEDEGVFIANNYRLFNYKESTLYFKKSIFKEKDLFIRETVIHELLHCHFGFWDTHIKAHLYEDANISSSAYSKLNKSISDAEEESVSILARSLARII